MKTTFVIASAGLVALALLVGYVMLLKPAAPAPGNSTGPAHESTETFKQGLQIGQLGTEQRVVINGTCNLATTAASFQATSSVQFVCPVTGARSGDLVIADLPVGAGNNTSGAGSAGGGFVIVGAYATTSNSIGVTLQNDTGAATSSYPQATTSVEYRILR